MEGLIWVHENLHGSNFLNKMVKFITMLGDMGIIWLTIAVILLFFRKTRRGAVVMVISLAVGFLINDFVLKNLFARERPFTINKDFELFIKTIGMELPSGYSFPSGHAYSSFNCAIMLTLFNKKFGLFVIPLALVIALSRIVLCVHYPTDVLAGAVLGIITALSVYLIYKKIINNNKRLNRIEVRAGRINDKN